MIKKKIMFFLLIFVVSLSSVAFAGYSLDQINARPEAVGMDSDGNAQTGIAPGNPIICRPTSTGPVSVEGFVVGGTYYPPDTPMISINENGNTGNVREGESITIGESYLNGTNDDMIVFNTLAEIVVMNEDAGPDNLYQNPTFEVGIYDDIIMTAKTWIDEVNRNEMLPDGVTMENYAELMGPYVAIEDIMRFRGDEFTTIKQFESVWDPTLQAMVIKGVDKSGILAIIGMGTNMVDIINFVNTQRLYTILGEGLVEINDPDDPDPDDPDPDEPDPDDPGGGGEGATWTSYGGVSMSASVSSANGMYSVTDAIPTSEEIKGTVSAKDIGWNYGINKVYKSTKYYSFEAYLCWDYGLIADDYYDKKGVYHPEVWGCRQSTTATVITNYTTHYFDVAYAEMSRLSNASVSNDTTGQLASVGPADTHGILSRIGDVICDDSDMPTTVRGCSHYGGYSGAFASAKANARAQIKKRTYAQNDYMVIGSGVLSGITPKGIEFGDAPNVGPYSKWSKPTQKDLSNSGTKMIPENKTNGWYDSRAGASYSAVPSFDGAAASAGASPDDVFVHTPVVNKTQITVEPFINQKIDIESGLTYLQLDKGFTINIPNGGKHIDAQGYGTRNGPNYYYNSCQAVPKKVTNWGKIKDVMLPFDAYLLKDHDNNSSTPAQRIIIKAGKWLSDYNLATAENSYTFLVPVWSEEAKGDIVTRVVAENIPIYNNGSTCNDGYIQEYEEGKENAANTNSSKYIAQYKIPVEVVGKIYDLRISGTNDPGWPGIKGKDGTYVTSPEFPFGQSGQNAMSQYKFAPKLGYVVEFDFKTKGVKTDNVDVSVQPEGFYFISKNGGEAEEVDLYFKTITNQYIKIAPGTNNSDIIVNLSNQFMRVAQSEVIDSTRIMKQQVGVLYTYVENVLIGRLPDLNIPEKLRLCYNNFAEYANALYGKSIDAISIDANGGLAYSTGKYDRVNNGKDTVIASVGHWYAGYRLPSSTIAVEPGTTPRQIMNNPNIAKKNGYILVKFDIVGKNSDDDYLRYTGPESITEPGQYDKNPDGSDKKWQDPETGEPDPVSPTQEIGLPNGKPGIVPDGIVILFETDMKANNDYEVIGSH